MTDAPDPGHLLPGVRVRRLHRGRLEPMEWTALAEADWGDVGVVLGAGGATGMAFEAGVLLALHTDFHHDLTDVRAIVGTSAGSVVGAMLTIGLDVVDLAAAVAGRPDHFSPAADALGVVYDPAVPTMPLLGIWRLPTPEVMYGAARHLAARRFRALLLHLMRTGSHDLSPALRFLDDVPWPGPADRLQICVTAGRTGRREVLTSSCGLSLATAVLASCAVPAVMRPVEVAAGTYVDGGVESPTNADLLAGPDGPGTVLVLSPMSGDLARSPIGWCTSRYAGTRLRRELQRFDPHQQVVVVEPTAALSAAVVDDALDPGMALQILGASYLGPSANGPASPRSRRRLQTTRS